MIGKLVHAQAVPGIPIVVLVKRVLMEPVQMFHVGHAKCVIIIMDAQLTPISQLAAQAMRIVPKADHVNIVIRVIMCVRKKLVTQITKTMGTLVPVGYMLMGTIILGNLNGMQHNVSVSAPLVLNKRVMLLLKEYITTTQKDVFVWGVPRGDKSVAVIVAPLQKFQKG